MFSSWAPDCTVKLYKLFQSALDLEEKVSLSEIGFYLL